MASQQDYSSVLNSELFARILELNFPWEGDVDMEQASPGQFFYRGEPDNLKELFDACHFKGLKPLSMACPSVPNLQKYLPQPDDPKYPEYTLALILLLDQVPRKLYGGMDARYTNAYFDTISKQLVKALISSNASPDKTEQWMTLGYSPSYVMVQKMWLYGPLVHSEDLADHELVASFTEKLRKEVEDYTGRQDPWREMKNEDSKDTTLFYKLFVAGPPKSFADFMFWQCRLFDAHKPIIEKYGRYPYRNEVQGRETTSEETEYLEETGGLGKPYLTQDQVKRLREQQQDGSWDPLSDRGRW